MRSAFIAAMFLGAAALAGAAEAVTATHMAPKKPESTKVVNIATRPGVTASQRMNLALSKAAIVQLNVDARDVLVSNPDIVDAIVRTPRRIFLLGQKSGQTNAFFFDAAGHQILTLDIHVERDVGDIQGLMHSEIPNSSIKVSSLNDTVILSGNATSASEAKLAVDLAARFAGDPLKVVNMIKVQANEQVMLKVRVAEMQRQVAKQFGINLATAAIANGVPLIASTSNPFSLVGTALSDASGAQLGSVCPGAFLPNVTSTSVSTTNNAIGRAIPSSVTQVVSKVPCASPNNLEGTLQALDRVGLIHTLAEPNLTAVSGETAKFLAGGEFPVPSGRDSSGNVSVIFKPFGVGLSFTPVVLSENRISLQLSTEVSELTNTGAFTLATVTTTDPTTGATSTVPGLTIPALNVRRAETTIELPSGGSFAMAGLLQHVTKQDLDSFPGLGSMPVLGALFRSRDFQNNETELAVIVTAYLVNPTSEKQLASPTDGFVPAADAETILLGRLNAVYKHNPNAIKAASDGQVGYIVQ